MITGTTGILPLPIIFILLVPIPLTHRGEEGGRQLFAADLQDGLLDALSTPINNRGYNPIREHKLSCSLESEFLARF
jgi:hypothetical protein